MALEIWNFVSSTIVAFILIPLVLYIKTRENVYITMSVGLITCIVIVEFIKHIIKQKRPKGARGCGIRNKDISNEGEMGMPSGHVATVAFFFMFLVLTTAESSYRFLIGIIGIPFIILMGVSRYYKKCHSVEQIIAGAFTGSLMAYLTLLVHEGLVGKLDI